MTTRDERSTVPGRGGGDGWHGWRNALIAAVALGVGLTFADVDQPLGLAHRHALTHSVLAPALVALHPRWRAAACGLAAGMAAHLAADVFPNAMVGFATVKLPGVGTLSASASHLWLAVNAAAALVLALVLARRLFAAPARGWLTAGGGVAGSGYLATTDGGWPVLAIALAAAALWWWRQRG